ncbi:30057_t:CDS:2 [Gigaspora margarita]|uniref:30057_t:CDS:1 n=1 Tax=Gigaspora margarita TaxID=4874 RepID=A0ABN7UML6_GIGMA|nr:30057_t:CDS:2 [Gigaspora margarita]
MSTSAGDKAPLPTINEVEEWTETEELIKFLREQNLGLKNNHFAVLREQEFNGVSFLKLNEDKLIKGQAVTTSSQKEELLQKVAELEMQLRKSIYDFDVVVAPKRTKSFKWPANVESTTIEEFKKSIYDIYKTPTLENPAVVLKFLSNGDQYFPRNDVCQLYKLSEDPNPDIDVYPVFLCGSVDLKCKKFQDVVKHLMAELELRQKTTPLNMSYEATKSIYSYCYLASGVSVYENNFKIVPEKLVMGHNGQGNLNYAIECLTTNRIVGLVEVKKDDFKQGFTQATVQMESSLTCQKRKANEINDKCGLDKVWVIVTDAEKWYFMEYTLDKGRPSFKLSEPVIIVYKDENMQMKVEKVLSHIIWLLKEAQKPVEASPNGEQSRVLKKQKSSCNLIDTSN